MVNIIGVGLVDRLNLGGRTSILSGRHDLIERMMVCINTVPSKQASIARQDLGLLVRLRGYTIPLESLQVVEVFKERIYGEEARLALKLAESLLVAHFQFTLVRACFLVVWVWDVHNDSSIVEVHLLTTLIRIGQEELRHLEHTNIILAVPRLNRVHHIHIRADFIGKRLMGKLAANITITLNLPLIIHLQNLVEVSCAFP